MLENMLVNDYGFSNYGRINDNLLYLDYIDNHYEFKLIAVDPGLCYKYQGNFVGLMKRLDIEPKLYLYTMYLNKINNPLSFDGNATTLKIPIKPPIPSS